jgi:hypothetical protein
MALTLSKANVELLRRILDDVLTGPEFNTQTSVSAFQLAEHLWRQASIGAPDFDRMKCSALSLVNSGCAPVRLIASHVDQSEIRRPQA